MSSMGREEEEKRWMLTPSTVAREEGAQHALPDRLRLRADLGGREGVSSCACSSRGVLTLVWSAGCTMMPANVAAAPARPTHFFRALG